MSKMAKTTVITRKSSVKIELTKKGTPVSDCTLSPFPACKDDEVTLDTKMFFMGEKIEEASYVGNDVLNFLDEIYGLGALRETQRLLAVNLFRMAILAHRPCTADRKVTFRGRMVSEVMSAEEHRKRYHVEKVINNDINQIVEEDNPYKIVAVVVTVFGWDNPDVIQECVVETDSLDICKAQGITLDQAFQNGTVNIHRYKDTTGVNVTLEPCEYKVSFRYERERLDIKNHIHANLLRDEEIKEIPDEDNHTVMISIELK